MPRPLSVRLDLLGDAGRLQQLLWNLFSNAIKFTPPGGYETLSPAIAGLSPSARRH